MQRIVKLNKKNSVLEILGQLEVIGLERMDVTLLEKLEKEEYFPPSIRPGSGIVTETKSFGELFAAAAGVEGDIPQNICSGIPELEAKGQMQDADAIVISMGGTNTHIAIIKLREGRIVRSNEITLLTPSYNKSDERVTVEEFIRPAIETFVNKLANSNISVEQIPRKIIVVWAFTQDIEFKEGQIYPRAIGRMMAKSQLKVQVEGVDLNKAFENALKEIIDMRLSEDDIDKNKSRQLNVYRYLNTIVECSSVNNDGIYAAQYFQALYGDHYNHIMLDINGTGTNIAFLASFYVDRETGGFIYEVRNGKNIPIRVNSKQIPPTGDNVSQAKYWVNMESGSLFPIYTETKYDQLDDDESVNFENIGVAGTGFGQAFKNILKLSGHFDDDILERIIGGRTKKNIDNADLTGLDIAMISNMYGLSNDSANKRLGNISLTLEKLKSIRTAADAVIIKSAMRKAQQITILADRNDFGMNQDQKDLLAVEGSIWKIPQYQDLVIYYTNRLIAAICEKDIQLNIDIACHPNHNASFDGPIFAEALLKSEQMMLDLVNKFELMQEELPDLKKFTKHDWYLIADKLSKKISRTTQPEEFKLIAIYKELRRMAR